MSQVAESYVYKLPDGSGYVGRHPGVGGARIIARKGDILSDEQVEELGLSDLKDHTDYDAIIAQAKEDGAEVSYRDKDGRIKMGVPK